MRVLIAVPTADAILPETVKGLFDLDTSGCECEFTYVAGYDCARARNLLAQRAITEKADYLLSVDSDVVLPSDALSNMLEHGEDVVIGFYARRGRFDGTTTVVRKGSADHPDAIRSDEIEALRERGITKVEVDAGGMGCALIRTSVFGRVEFPYFKFQQYKSGNCLSEDYYFFKQCRKVKAKVFLDTRVGCDHIFRHRQCSMWSTTQG